TSSRLAGCPSRRAGRTWSIMPGRRPRTLPMPIRSRRRRPSRPASETSVIQPSSLQRTIDRLLADRFPAGLPLRHLAAIGRDRSQRRHLPTWVASMRKNYLLTKPSPWVTFDAIDHIENYLRSQRRPLRAFEYGSGGSTLYWQSRQVECVSVEHDPAWYELVRERIVPERV